jgi:hypothetical protein
VNADDRERLRRVAAARAEENPFFLASALAAYRRLMGLDDAALAAHLGCSVAALPHLALCRRPEGDSPMFRDDLTRIAAYVGCDPARLAQLLRAAEAADRMRVASPGALLAARDRRDDDDDGDGEPDEPDQTTTE